MTKWVRDTENKYAAFSETKLVCKTGRLKTDELRNEKKSLETEVQGKIYELKEDRRSVLRNV
jgi:hypothetical protein